MTAADLARRADPPVAPRRRKVALVIGAGSVKCAASLGLWRVLRREGLAPDMYVGCSGGSVYAAAMALGFDVDEAVRMTTAMWGREITARRDWMSMLRAVVPGLRFGGSFGLVDDRALRKALGATLGGRTFAEAATPLYVVATALADGRQVTVSEGSIFDAVRASVAIPYVWNPWPVNGEMLLDGCLSAPLPVDVAIREGADLILAMGFDSPYPRRIRSAMRYAFQLSTIATNNLLRANYAFHNLAHHAEIIPILPTFDGNVGLFDTHRFPHVIECGERAAEEQLPYLRQLLGTAA